MLMVSKKLKKTTEETGYGWKQKTGYYGAHRDGGTG